MFSSLLSLFKRKNPNNEWKLTDIKHDNQRNNSLFFKFEYYEPRLEQVLFFCYYTTFTDFYFRGQFMQRQNFQRAIQEFEQQNRIKLPKSFDISFLDDLTKIQKRENLTF